MDTDKAHPDSVAEMLAEEAAEAAEEARYEAEYEADLRRQQEEYLASPEYEAQRLAWAREDEGEIIAERIERDVRAEVEADWNESVRAQWEHREEWLDFMCGQPEEW